MSPAERRTGDVMLPAPPAIAAAAPPAAARAPELTVVVPTYNERDNVALVCERLAAALDGIGWEAIFVDDDSPDETAARLRELALADPRIRVIQRIGRRGLASAVIEGMLASSAPYLAVMDADLQHDERLLPQMLRAIREEGLDIVIGSRHVAGGGTGDWDRRRVRISTWAAQLARIVVSADLKDPMSGFFVVTRPALERSVRRLSGQGFKILLDLFASAPAPYRYKELPYTFRSRLHGESKLDGFVALEYLTLLFDKRFGRFVPARFVLFAAVGGSGVVVHLTTLYLTLAASGWFVLAQTAATVVAMTSNFVLNNLLTYRDRRLSGRRFAMGLLSFYAICSVGAVANVGIAAAAFAQQYTWWLSGLAGAAVGVVWNYAISSVFTWRQR